MSNYVDLSECVTATFYSDEYEEWIQKTVTITEVLDSVCNNYTVLSSAKLKQEWIPRWIPVTERLPKKKEKKYWICTNSGYQCQARWTNNRYGLGPSKNWGWAGISLYTTVVAWMPLPEPYKEGENGCLNQQKSSN